MKISPTGKGSVQYGTKKYAQQNNSSLMPPETGDGNSDYGPPSNSAAPVTPNNPNWNQLPRLTGSTVVLMGSSLDITNAEHSISLPLTPEQIAQLREELGGEAI